MALPRMLDSGRMENHSIEEWRVLKKTGNTSSLDPSDSDPVGVASEGYDVVPDPFESWNTIQLKNPDFRKAVIQSMTLFKEPD